MSYGCFATVTLLAMMLTPCAMAASVDETAIRKIIQDEVTAWNRGDAVAYSATSPGTSPDDKGRLRTRLLQVVARQGGQWKIVAYHNTDVKPGVPVPEPK